MSPTTREAGWSAALSLPYKYENNCLIVDSNRYYFESTEVPRNELIHFGWLPPELLPTELVDGYLLVVEDLPEAGWAKPDLLPYLKTEHGLFVENIYNYEYKEAGWQCAVDLLHIYQLVIGDNYCPECGSTKVMSVVFDDCEDYYKSYHHCPNCLWLASLIPYWIEQHYFL